MKTNRTTRWVTSEDKWYMFEVAAVNQEIAKERFNIEPQVWSNLLRFSESILVADRIVSYPSNRYYFRFLVQAQSTDAVLTQLSRAGFFDGGLLSSTGVTNILKTVRTVDVGDFDTNPIGSLLKYKKNTLYQELKLHTARMISTYNRKVREAKNNLIALEEKEKKLKATLEAKQKFDERVEKHGAEEALQMTITDNYERGLEVLTELASYVPFLNSQPYSNTEVLYHSATPEQIWQTINAAARISSPKHCGFSNFIKDRLSFMRGYNGNYRIHKAVFNGTPDEAFKCFFLHRVFYVQNVLENKNIVWFFTTSDHEETVLRFAEQLKTLRFEDGDNGVNSSREVYVFTLLDMKDAWAQLVHIRGMDVIDRKKRIELLESHSKHEFFKKQFNSAMLEVFITNMKPREMFKNDVLGAEVTKEAKEIDMPDKTLFENIDSINRRMAVFGIDKLTIDNEIHAIHKAHPTLFQTINNRLYIKSLTPNVTYCIGLFPRIPDIARYLLLREVICVRNLPDSGITMVIFGTEMCSFEDQKDGFVNFLVSVKENADYLNLPHHTSMLIAEKNPIMSILSEEEEKYGHVSNKNSVEILSYKLFKTMLATDNLFINTESQKKETEMANNTESFSNKVLTAVKEDAQDAAWRTGGRQLVKFAGTSFRLVIYYDADGITIVRQYKPSFGS